MESLGIAELTASIAPYLDKVAQVQSAVQAIESQRPGLTNLFGLFAEGGGRRNEMSICNGTDCTFQLVKWYLHWGHVKVPPNPLLESMKKDECLFHNAGSWACTGSSGMVTYQLDDKTNLHILWECPYNFDFYDNYIGLMLTSEPHLKIPEKCLFLSMFEDWKNMGRHPRAGSSYDLVCCGPGDGSSRDAGGSKPYGHKRPCKVQDSHYTVYATMGDRHATASKIVIRNI